MAWFSLSNSKSPKMRLGGAILLLAGLGSAGVGYIFEAAQAQAQLPSVPVPSPAPAPKAQRVTPRKPAAPPAADATKPTDGANSEGVAKPLANAAPQPSKTDPRALTMIIRALLITLDQANKTGNYSVLRDIGAPDFIVGNSTARLAEIFAGQRSQKLDIAAAAILEPQITMQPQSEPNGLLHFAGFIPAEGSQLKFEFLLQNGRLYGLSVNLAQAGASPSDAKPGQPSTETRPAPSAEKK